MVSILSGQDAILTWIGETIDLIGRVNDGKDGVSDDHWHNVNCQASGFAIALGRSDAAKIFQEHLPVIETVLEKEDGTYDWETPERLVRDEIKQRLKDFQSCLTGKRGRYNSSWSRLHVMLDDEGNPGADDMQQFCTRYNRGRKNQEEAKLDVRKLKGIIADRKRK